MNSKSITSVMPSMATAVMPAVAHAAPTGIDVGKVGSLLEDQVTRLQLKVGDAYGADIARVQQILLAAVRSNLDLQRSPPASVYGVGLGDPSLNFEVRAFVDSYDKRLRVQHGICMAIEHVLRDNGIEIPLLQRGLQFCTARGTGQSGPTGDSGPARPRAHPA